MYQYGEGILTDYKWTYMWYTIAAYNGSDLDAKNKIKIANSMTPVQIAKVQEMSEVLPLMRAILERTQGMEQYAQISAIELFVSRLRVRV